MRSLVWRDMSFAAMYQYLTDSSFTAERFLSLVFQEAFFLASEKSMIVGDRRARVPSDTGVTSGTCQEHNW